MAVHKVPQDVEAEDKFLGPLSFKQFLFFGGFLVSLFVMYQLAVSPLPFLAIIVLPFLIVCVALAFPWTPDQPTELWLASRIRFMLVQRKRIWDQDGVKDLVTITAPKREVHIYTDGLSQAQIQSRLAALANVIDSKGWAIKNLNGSAQLQTDRLVSGFALPQAPLKQMDVPDPLDDQQSGVAQNLNAMIQQAEERRKLQTRQLVDQALHSAPAPPPPPSGAVSTPFSAASAPVGGEPWFLQSTQFNSSTPASMQATQQPSTPTSEEQAFLDRLHQQQEDEAKIGRPNRLKVIQPAGEDNVTSNAGQESATTDPAATTNDTGMATAVPTPPSPSPVQAQTAYPTSPPTIDPAIMSLSQNDDLNVETLARQANRVINMGEDDEIIISLHDND